MTIVDKIYKITIETIYKHKIRKDTVMKRSQGITLVALVITIILLLILAGISIALTIGPNGIFNKAKEAKIEQELANIKESIVLELLDAEAELSLKGKILEREQVKEIVSAYGELQADEDTLKIRNSEAEIKISELYKSQFLEDGEYTQQKEKIKQLENRIQELEAELANKGNVKLYKIGTYSGVTVTNGSSLCDRMNSANTIEINIQEKYSDYKNLAVNNFLMIDAYDYWDSSPAKSYYTFNTQTSKIVNYNSETGILKLKICYGAIDCADNTYDVCIPGSTTLYLINHTEIPNL